MKAAPQPPYSLDLPPPYLQVAAAPLIQKHLAADPRWQSMLNAALAYVGSPAESRKALETPQTKPRLGSTGRSGTQPLFPLLT